MASPARRRRERTRWCSSPASVSVSATRSPSLFRRSPAPTPPPAGNSCRRQHVLHELAVQVVQVHRHPDGRLENAPGREQHARRKRQRPERNARHRPGGNGHVVRVGLDERGHHTRHAHDHIGGQHPPRAVLERRRHHRVVGPAGRRVDTVGGTATGAPARPAPVAGPHRCQRRGARAQLGRPRLRVGPRPRQQPQRRVHRSGRRHRHSPPAVVSVDALGGRRTKDANTGGGRRVRAVPAERKEAPPCVGSGGADGRQVTRGGRRTRPRRTGRPWRGLSVHPAVHPHGDGGQRGAGSAGRHHAQPPWRLDPLQPPRARAQQEVPGGNVARRRQAVLGQRRLRYGAPDLARASRAAYAAPHRRQTDTRRSGSYSQPTDAVGNAPPAPRRLQSQLWGLRGGARPPGDADQRARPRAARPWRCRGISGRRCAGRLPGASRPSGWVS